MSNRGSFAGGLASAIQTYMALKGLKKDADAAGKPAAAKAPADGGVSPPASPDQKIASTDVPAPPAIDPQPVKVPDGGASPPAAAAPGMGDPNVYAWPADEGEAPAPSMAGSEGAAAAAGIGGAGVVPAASSTPVTGG